MARLVTRSVSLLRLYVHCLFRFASQAQTDFTFLTASPLHTSSPAHLTNLQHCGLLGYTAVRSGTWQTAEHAASLFRVRTGILGKWMPKLVAPPHDPHINAHSSRASLPLLTPSSNSSDISTTPCSVHNNQINSLLARPGTRILSQTLTPDHTASWTGTPR